MWMPAVALVYTSIYLAMHDASIAMDSKEGDKEPPDGALQDLDSV